MKQEKRICCWCKKPMGNSWHKSADGNYIHVKCVSNFKSYFKYKKLKEEYTKCRKCGYQPMSLDDSVRHSIDGCEKDGNKKTR